MSEPIVQQIRHHLSTLPQHVRQRRTATLLDSALSAIEDLTSALRELTDSFDSAAKLLKEMEDINE